MCKVLSSFISALLAFTGGFTVLHQCLLPCGQQLQTVRVLLGEYAEYLLGIEHGRHEFLHGLGLCGPALCESLLHEIIGEEEASFECIQL